MTSPRRLEIVIDELVVRGLPPHAAREAATALERRLTTLAEQAPRQIPGRAEAFRRLSPVAVPAGSPSTVGEAVAGVVWGALSGGSA